MKIAHEVPLFLLNESRSFCDFDYGLIHLFAEYPEYYAFFVNSLKLKREVIIDNSVFELETPFDPISFAATIKKLLKDSKADPRKLTYIIPDTLDDSVATISSVKAFIKKYKKLPGRKMAVVQGKTMQELLDCYLALVPLVDKIGISFNCKAYEDFAKIMNMPGTLLEQWMHGRQYFIETLFHAGWLSTDKPLHLLGIALPTEYGYYTYSHAVLDKYIETADTSNPIVHGILGIKYDSQYGLTEKTSIKLVEMINIEKAKCDTNAIKLNIKLFRSLNHLKSLEDGLVKPHLTDILINVGKQR